jgi:hypothetical protein
MGGATNYEDGRHQPLQRQSATYRPLLSYLR